MRISENGGLPQLKVKTKNGKALINFIKEKIDVTSKSQLGENSDKQHRVLTKLQSILYKTKHNIHQNSFDMNILYEAKRAKQAREIREREEAYHKELERRRLIRENREQFNKDIREGDYKGRLSYLSLRELNSVYKKDYIEFIMREEAPQVHSYLDNVIDEVEDKQDELHSVVWGIEDTQHVWENQIDKINLRIYEKAEEFGLEKSQMDN